MFERMDSGVIPCSMLKRPWISRRRSVSRRASAIDSVTLSAYMMTSPFTLRAARPEVWMSEVDERR